ncbi:glycoside hydrolase family 3 N-terminal domain-containing protein [Glycomyces sp. NPDC046736]|uniref:glycoside hydrolase family 3 protein n=1 Tax=Glycomyces sp. NPDC046736 TaxID=3155615 RepID=UPI0033FAD264
MPSPKLSRKSVLAASVTGAFAVVGGGAVIAEATSRDEEPREDDRETIPDQDPDFKYASETLAAMSLHDKVGQLFMVYVSGASADESAESNRTRLGSDTAAEFIAANRPGGVIYFDWANGLDDPAQVAALSNGLQEAAASGGGVPLLIAADQEYGTVVRIGEPATQFPGSMALGATGDTDAAANAAQVAGTELRAMGLNQNFAPDADVNVDPANPVIGVRAFGSDSELVAGFTAAQVTGYQAGGVAVSAKHFPGHGDTGTDSHVGLPVITHTVQEWESIDAPPFRAAIEAGTDLVMTGHLQFPALDDSLAPATLSAPILTGLLRDELGFTGVVITDSLEMEGVRTEFGDDHVPVLALLAGADMLLMPPDFTLARDAVLAAVEAGELTEDRVDESVRRILLLKYRRGIVADPSTDPAGVDTVGAEAHRELAADIASRSITLLANDGTLPFAGGSILVTGWGENTTARLAEAFGSGATVHTSGDAPDEAAIGAAVAAADGKDLVVVATHDVTADAPQVDLVAALVATGVPVVTAAVGTPYDAAYLGPVNASLASYSYSAVSLAALAKAIAGELGPTGKLPVDVLDASGAVAYPLGHGLDFS